MKRFLFAIVYFVSLMLTSAAQAAAAPAAQQKTTRPATQKTGTAPAKTTGTKTTGTKTTGTKTTGGTSSTAKPKTAQNNTTQNKPAQNKTTQGGGAKTTGVKTNNAPTKVSQIKLPTGKYKPEDFDIPEVTAQSSTHISQNIQEKIEIKLSENSQIVKKQFDEVGIALGLNSVYKALGEAAKKDKKQEEATNPLSEEEAKKFLRELSANLARVAKQEKNSAAKYSLMYQGLIYFPIFESFGALDPDAKKWEAGQLRKYIREHLSVCSSAKYNTDELECNTTLTAIRVLPVLDDKFDQKDDALLVYDFMEKNHQSANAAAVLQTSAIALISLGRANMLVGFVEKADKQSLGFWDRVGNIFSLEYWSEKQAELDKTATRILSNKVSSHLGTERWVSRANQGSYYTAKDEKGNKRLGNIYQDLGEWLASEQENGKYIYRDQIDISGFIHPYENGTLVVDSSAFVAGLLLGGMKLPNTNELRMRTSGSFQDANGRTKTVDTTKAWNAVQKRLNETHMTTTGMVIAELYAHPKTEMTHEQRHALNNRLVDAYDKAVQQVNGMIYKPKWMNKEQTTLLEKIQDTRFAISKEVCKAGDIAIAVVGMVTMVGAAASAFSVAKLASFGIRTMSRARAMIALARGQKGVLSVEQLRSLAKVRAALKASASAGAFAGREVSGANTAKASAQALKTTVKTEKTAQAAGAANRATTAANTAKNTSNVAAADKAARAAAVAQQAAADAAAATDVTTATAAADRAAKAASFAEKVAANAETTSAVYVPELENQVTGALGWNTFSDLPISERLGYGWRLTKEGFSNVWDGYNNYTLAAIKARKNSGMLFSSVTPFVPGFMTPGFGKQYAAVKQASQLTREEKALQAMIDRLTKMGYNDGTIVHLERSSNGVTRMTRSVNGFLQKSTFTTTEQEFNALTKLKVRGSAVTGSTPGVVGRTVAANTTTTARTGATGLTAPRGTTAGVTPRTGAKPSNGLVSYGQGENGNVTLAFQRGNDVVTESFTPDELGYILEGRKTIWKNGKVQDVSGFRATLQSAAEEDPAMKALLDAHSDLVKAQKDLNKAKAQADFVRSRGMGSARTTPQEQTAANAVEAAQSRFNQAVQNLGNKAPAAAPEEAVLGQSRLGGNTVLGGETPAVGTEAGSTAVQGRPTVEAPIGNTGTPGSSAANATNGSTAAQGRPTLDAPTGNPGTPGGNSPRGSSLRAGEETRDAALGEFNLGDDVVLGGNEAANAGTGAGSTVQDVEAARRAANPVRDSYWEVLQQDAKENSSSYWDNVARRLREAGDNEYAQVAAKKATEARQIEATNQAARQKALQRQQQMTELENTQPGYTRAEKQKYERMAKEARANGDEEMAALADQRAAETEQNIVARTQQNAANKAQNRQTAEANRQAKAARKAGQRADAQAQKEEAARQAQKAAEQKAREEEAARKRQEMLQRLREEDPGDTADKQRMWERRAKTAREEGDLERASILDEKAQQAQLNVEAKEKARAAQREANRLKYEAQQQRENALKGTAETVLQDAQQQMAGLKKVGSHEGLLSNQANEAIGVIRNSGGDAKAEELYAQYDQWRKSLHQTLEEGGSLESDAFWAKNRPDRVVDKVTPEQLTGRGTKLAQQAQSVMGSAEKMDPLVSQLRQIQLRTHVKNLGQTRIAAQRKLAAVRQTLQQANAGKVPTEQTTYLRRALEKAEKLLNDTQQTGRNALAAGKDGSRSLSRVIDETYNTQRKIEAAVDDLDEVANAFQNNWGTWLERGQNALAGTEAQGAGRAGAAVRGSTGTTGQAARQGGQAAGTTAGQAGTVVQTGQAGAAGQAGLSADTQTWVSKSLTSLNDTETVLGNTPYLVVADNRGKVMDIMKDVKKQLTALDNLSTSGKDAATIQRETAAIQEALMQRQADLRRLREYVEGYSSTTIGGGYGSFGSQGAEILEALDTTIGDIGQVITHL